MGVKQFRKNEKNPNKWKLVLKIPEKRNTQIKYIFRRSSLVGSISNPWALSMKFLSRLLHFWTSYNFFRRRTKFHRNENIGIFLSNWISFVTYKQTDRQKTSMIYRKQASWHNLHGCRLAAIKNQDLHINRSYYKLISNIELGSDMVSILSVS